jgi:hypothetical protein
MTTPAASDETVRLSTGPLGLDAQLREARRYYVTGIIENADPAPQRWGEAVDAESPRQAEDAARQQVAGTTAPGRGRGNLWVAGVYQLNLDADGFLLDPPLVMVDGYAKYVDPDRTDEVL